MNTEIQDLHSRAMKAAELNKKSESDLISILQKLDQNHGYLHFDASSLYDYCVSVLKLSESTSYNLITVARKAREVPALKEAIDAGEITLSKARKIAPVITMANQEVWLSLAKTETSRIIEKAVAKESPEFLIKESVRYRSEDRVELKIGISEDLLKKLAQICDLESQKQSKPVSREEALLAAAEVYLEKNDPIKKAERKLDRVTPSQLPKRVTTQRAEKPVPGHVNNFKPRPHIPAAISHAIALRDRRQCTHLNPSGERCKNTRWLEIHHIQPKSLGGPDTPVNLTTLCSTHHAFLHRPGKLVRSKQVVE